MGITYDNDFYDDKALTLDEPLRFPRIGYDNVVTEQNVIGSSSLAGFPAESVGNALTYELWKPSTLPASLDIDAGEPVTADYVAFGAHNLSGCLVTLSYSTDGSTYAPAIEGVVIRNKAGMMLFEPVTARYWRLDILGWAASPTLDLDFQSQAYAAGDYTDADDTYLGVLYLGRALQMQRGIYQGHTPGEFARSDEIRPNVSEGGQWLGRTVIRKGYDTTYSFSNLKADWVRSTLAPFLDAAVTDPFFIAWRPETKADEVLMGWTQGPIVPTNSGPRDLMSVDFTVSAHGEQEPAADKFTADQDTFDNLLTFTRASTGTYFDSTGTLQTAAVDEPRFDHDPVTGEPLGLLIEEQRTNLLLWSEDFDNAAWTKTSVTVSANVRTAPDGTATADKLIVDNGAATVSAYLIQSGVSKSANAVLTTSFIAEAGEFDRALLLVQDSGTSANRVTLTVSLTDGSVISALSFGTYTVQDYDVKPLSGGRFRISLTVQTGSETTSAVRIYAQDSVATTGDGNSGIYIWGAQLEQGSFPTSYIRTEGAQVTRLADNCSRPLGAEFNADEFTFFIIFSWVNSNNTAFPLIGMIDGPEWSARVDARGLEGFGRVLVTKNGNLNPAGALAPIALGAKNRVAISFSQTRVTAAFDGVVVFDIAASGLTGDFQDLVLADTKTTISSSRLFPRALSATELQELTAP